jgi:CheY-specific phosphatase CheX
MMPSKFPEQEYDFDQSAWSMVTELQNIIQKDLYQMHGVCALAL